MGIRNIPHKTIVAMVVLVLVICPPFFAQASSLQLTSSPEYNTYVHTCVDSELGNYTSIDKPVFPVMINNSQTQIGQNWTITCPLVADHNYHLYCYGEWVSTTASATTDYDLYIYDPAGKLVSSHTEAAGFPESVSSDQTPFFTPTQSGSYSFVIKNSAADSKGSQQATFMVIESLECNQWYTCNLEGYSGNQSTLRTGWAYEFATNQSKVEVYIKIPSTLDMYEARLYLMNDYKNTLLVNDYPLPWEQGLYGNVSAGVGGYNFEPDGYRGVAYESCEYMGQDMFLNYTAAAANKGLELYQLVLIGEVGQGPVEFMMKTNFDVATLTQANVTGKVLPSMAASVEYKTDGANLVQANISYTDDGWDTVDTVAMDVWNQTCNATIPTQTAGTTIQYLINAMDLLNNYLSASGNYTVKTQPTLNVTLAKDTVFTGQNVTVSGKVTPNDKNSIVVVQFLSANSTESVDCKVRSDGTFNATWQPQEAGDYAVFANAPETKTSWSADGSQLTLTVNEPPFYMKYQLFIALGLIGALAAGGAVYYLKFMRR